MLIGARFVQGLGTAMIVPSTPSTLNAMFHGRTRAIAFAVWGSEIGGMAASGPLVGGWWRQNDGSLSPVPVALVVGLVLMIAFVHLERARRTAGKDVLAERPARMCSPTSGCSGSDRSAPARSPR